MISYADAIDAHYARNWSAPIERQRWTAGPIEALPVDFRVLVIPRSPEITAYATRCMSQPADAERLELHVMTRAGGPLLLDVVELLTVVAHYHRTGSPLGLGHSVNFGRPWLAGSACTRGLISLPYLDGSELEWLAEPRVRFLWLIPVTDAELLFRKREGTEALEAKFEAARFDFLDPLRASVV